MGYDPCPIFFDQELILKYFQRVFYASKFNQYYYHYRLRCPDYPDNARVCTQEPGRSKDYPGYEPDVAAPVERYRHHAGFHLQFSRAIGVYAGCWRQLEIRCDPRRCAHCLDRGDSLCTQPESRSQVYYSSSPACNCFFPGYFDHRVAFWMHGGMLIV